MQRRSLLASASCLVLGCASRARRPSTVSELASRSVSSPRRFGWLSSRRETGELPSAIALGAQPVGRVLLYFEFETPGELASLSVAELVLQTAGPPGHGVDVELSRAEAARGELRAWGDQPRALYPRIAARLASNQERARLDVTELLRAESKPGAVLRLLLRAEPTGDEPVSVQTGAGGGAAPVLEAYFL
jgi:hypothetical protein